MKKPDLRPFPARLNVTELAGFYGTSRNTIYATIQRGSLEPDAEGGYDRTRFEYVVQEHCPNLVEDTKSAAGVLRKFIQADVERFRWRRKLEEMGYSVSD